MVASRRPKPSDRVRPKKSNWYTLRTLSTYQRVYHFVERIFSADFDLVINR